MGIFHPYLIRCACGTDIACTLADSINVVRFPESRQKILNGTLHRVKCSSCARNVTVEKSFYYTDLSRNTLLRVAPRQDRHHWKSASELLNKAFEKIPTTILSRKKPLLRVVFGLDELREKLIAQDEAIDDRSVELIKALILHEHPFLLQRPRLRLALDRVSSTHCDFMAGHEHSQKKYRISMPRHAADKLLNAPSKAKLWAGASHITSIMDLPQTDRWVNFWRWSPQPIALDQLKLFGKKALAGSEIDVMSKDFQQMIDGLPRGSQLPAWAKQELQNLMNYAKSTKNELLKEKLFEIRFGKELDSDWGNNKLPDDIDTLWNLFENLPDDHIEGNTKIDEIQLGAPGSGSTYNPSGYDISISPSDLSNTERFEDTVRHEVGHGVHEKLREVIDPWLTTRFGWQSFHCEEDKDIDVWVNLMGGWGTAKALEREQVRAALRQKLGAGSSWVPGDDPKLPADHLWNTPDFAPRLAAQKTGAYWYQNLSSWHTVNGKVFFLNYWYQTLLVMNTSTRDLILSMPSTYAAMSHFEFFAELYSLFYDLDDPKRSSIPKEIIQWLDANIDSMHPQTTNAVSPGSPKEKKKWETILRPSS
jgi:CpXC protein